MIVKTMIAILFFAAHGAGTHAAGLVDRWVSVPTDQQLKMMRMSRGEANKKCPDCEREWRKAWNVSGTKLDNKYYQGIRKTSAAPLPLKKAE